MSNFFVNLNHLDLMAIVGKDSKKFLQGQLTCDVEALQSHQSCLGASCDNKGRVLSSFRLTRLFETYYLEMQTGLLESFKSALDKYAVFYKTDSSSAALSFRRFGLIGEEAHKLLSNIFPSLPTEDNNLISHEGMHLLQINAELARYQLWLEPEKQESICQQLAENLSQGHIENWDLLDLQAGIYHLEPKDIGLYTPQLLNYDISSAVSFSKGCYTGQEIVARMHYRGEAKKRLFHLHIESGVAPSQDNVITSHSGEKLGSLLKFLKINNNTYEALAILNVKSEQAGLQPLLLDGQSGSRITLLALTY